MTTPTTAGWYPHPDDPMGVHRWFDGTVWANRTDAATDSPVVPPPAASTPALTPQPQHEPEAAAGRPPAIGWYHRPGDPRTVTRWYAGEYWSNDFSGGTTAEQAAAVKLPVPVRKANPDRWRLPDTSAAPAATPTVDIFRANYAQPAGKSKTTAVLLAVFFSFWTWLYTYRQDSNNFWTSIGIQACSVLLTFLIVAAHGSAALALFIWFGSDLGLWLWAVIGRATQPAEYYSRLTV